MAPVILGILGTLGNPQNSKTLESVLISRNVNSVWEEREKHLSNCNNTNLFEKSLWCTTFMAPRFPSKTSDSVNNK